MLNLCCNTSYILLKEFRAMDKFFGHNTCHSYQAQYLLLASPNKYYDNLTFLHLLNNFSFIIIYQFLKSRPNKCDTSSDAFGIRKT